MIKSIRLQNFFGFQDCTINLENGENVLVGINGSGKSNFFKAIKLLEASARDSFSFLFLSEWGGFEAVSFLGNKDFNPITPEYTIDGPSIAKFGFKFKEDIHYKITITKVAGGNNYTLSEKVFMDRSDKGHFIYLDINSGKGHLLERKNDTDKATLVRYDKLSDREPYLGKVFDTDRYLALSTLRTAIEKLTTYDQFDTGKYSPIRKSVLATSENILSSNGGNLTSLLQTFKSNDKVTLRKIVEALRSVSPKYKDVDYGAIGGGNIELQIEEENFRRNIPSAHISDGTLRFLCLMAILYNPNRGTVVCIDEPELGLHPDMINTLYRAIEYAAKTGEIIISTHSAHLLDYFKLENIRVFEKDENNATIVEQYTDQDFEGWYKTFNPGQMWRAGDIGGNRW